MKHLKAGGDGHRALQSTAGLGPGCGCNSGSVLSAERDQHLHADGALGALRLLRERHRGKGRDSAGAAAGVPRRGAGGYHNLSVPGILGMPAGLFSTGILGRVFG